MWSVDTDNAAHSGTNLERRLLSIGQAKKMGMFWPLHRQDNYWREREGAKETKKGGSKKMRQRT